MNAEDPDTNLAGNSIRGDGLGTDGTPVVPRKGRPDLDDAVRATVRGGDGLATTGSAPQEGEDPAALDEAVKDTPRGGEGLADDAG